MIIYIVIIAIFVFVPALTFIGLKEINKQDDKKEITDNNYEKNKVLIEDAYEVYKTKPLTEGQIADIHARGKITPAEKVKELEGLGMCIGDYAGSAAWRCHKFGNCHDCLTDYANTKDEHVSFFDDLKIVCK